MGTGTPVLTAVAVTQWSCASSGYLCFSPRLPPRGSWGENKRLLVAFTIPGTHLWLRDQSEMHATVTEPACHVLHSGNSFWLWYNCFHRCAGLHYHLWVWLIWPQLHCCQVPPSSAPAHCVPACCAKAVVPKLVEKILRSNSCSVGLCQKGHFTHTPTHPPNPPHQKTPKLAKNNPKRLFMVCCIWTQALLSLTGNYLQNMIVESCWVSF